MTISGQLSICFFGREEGNSRQNPPAVHSLIHFYADIKAKKVANGQQISSISKTICRFWEMKSSAGWFAWPFDREREGKHWFIIQLNDSLLSCFRAKERTRVSVPSSNLRHPMFFCMKSIYLAISQGNRKIRSVKHWSHWPISLYLIPDDDCFLACYDNQFPFSPRWKQ